ncbi:MAG: tetratricopeptide repeat protein [Alphaproteobacteria bacterium]|nr:tetratricopeptide repeat protein [Alphaproteobacteria bacterium]
MAALPAWAQTLKADAAQCASPHPDLAIVGCTALIQMPKQTNKMLVFAYNDRAWAYHALGKDTEGLRDVDMALLLAPNDAPVIETRAEIYEKLGKRDEAIADYRTALKLDPKMKEASAGLQRLKAMP